MSDKLRRELARAAGDGDLMAAGLVALLERGEVSFVEDEARRIVFGDPDMAPDDRVAVTIRAVRAPHMRTSHGLIRARWQIVDERHDVGVCATAITPPEVREAQEAMRRFMAEPGRPIP